jgi:hypothetical protein
LDGVGDCNVHRLNGSDFHRHTSPSTSITEQQSPHQEATKNNVIYLCVVIQRRRTNRRKKYVKMKLTKNIKFDEYNKKENNV